MQGSKKPVLILPYHDPKKKFNACLSKNIDLLKEIFSDIFISATPPTVKDNNESLLFLKKSGCFVYENKEGTQIGDHFRNGLKVYLEKSHVDRVYFGFIDRIIFNLETKHKNSFTKDISAKYKNDLVIFSRSQKAWNTHPKDYYLSEKILNDAGKILFDQDFDWVWCGALIQRNLVKEIIKESRANDFSVMPEFVLISLSKKANIKNKNVEWQEWEAPFWAKKEKRKISKELTQGEKEFRLGYIAKSLNLFLEK